MTRKSGVHHVAILSGLALGLSALGLSAGQPLAQEDYPNKPIRLVVPYVGGTADYVGRIFAEELGKRLGQEVVIENRAGASGTIGTDLVAKAEPDGYTLLIGQTNALAVAPHLIDSLPYDPGADFAPISLTVRTAQILLVDPDLGIESVEELIDAARAEPGKLVYASSGNGDSSHLAAEIFKAETETDLLHVPYEGSSKASLAVISGEAQLVFSGIVQGLPHMMSGELTALGVSTAERAKGAPEVPTIDEAGVPGYELSFWSGIVAPAGTPPEIIERLNAEINAIVETPEVRQKLIDRGLNPTTSTSQEFADLIAADIKKYGQVIEAAGITVD